MQLESPSQGRRPGVYHPERLGGFRLLHGRGRFYAVPEFLDPNHNRDLWLLTDHPATISAATQEELENRIETFDGRQFQAEPLGRCEGYDLIRHQNSIYALPATAGQVDINLEEERWRTASIHGFNREEVEQRLRQMKVSFPIEFAGWLPIYEATANCGRHPQFTHTAEPPPGYHFTSSAPPRRLGKSRGRKSLEMVGRNLLRLGKMAWSMIWMFLVILGFGPRVGLRARWRVFRAVVGLYFTLRRGGGRLLPILSFLKSRHYTSQLMMGQKRDLVFLTSMPFTYGQNPWVIEIEDPTTLFHPHIQNGHTCDLPVRESPYFPIVKAHLEAESCKGLITHMRSTARMVKTMFGSEIINAKVHYAPLGVKLPRQFQDHQESKEIHLLFTNSWHQQSSGFFVRGGLDVLEAFTILRERYPNLRLTMRTNLPHLDPHYHRLVEKGWVRLIHRYMQPRELEKMIADSHIFVLPAARVHIVSLLQAMSHGLAVVATDGWGVEEYLTHERNGLVVKGRYNKVSWVDEEAGWLREDYDSLYTSDPAIVAGLVDATSRLIEDRMLRQRLGKNARHDVEHTYNLENWNAGLKLALDRATNRMHN